MAKASDGLGLLIAGPVKDEGEESGADEAAVMAAEGVLKAIKRNDASALYRALEEVYQHCKGGEMEPDDDYDDEESDEDEG